jgi:hypothetical protein
MGKQPRTLGRRSAKPSRDEAVAIRRKLVRDYAAGRSDAKQILKDLETAQLELLDRGDC